MAVIINTLTPESPQIPAGTSVTFTVNATSTLDNNLTYLWEFSNNNGVTWSSQGLFGNTGSTFTTSNLTQNQSGLYFRVVISDGDTTVFSNEDPNIGNRIVIVSAAPQILLLEDYEPSFNVGVGEEIELTVSATVANADITNPSTLDDLLITWQVSVDSGASWVNVLGGDITVTVFELGSTPQTYGKQSVYTIPNIQFDQNLYEYRARITYPNANNTPVVLESTIVFVNPVISVYKQPGELPDTQITNCYKTSIPNSGNATWQVGAFTTANRSLQFEWEFSEDGGDTWREMQFGVDRAWFRITPGTTTTSDILSIQRLIYFEQFGVRCTVSGEVGEVPVLTDPGYITMTDVEEPVIVLEEVDVVEDRYGDISNRGDFVQPESYAQILGAIDTYRNTGLNGDIVLQIQRKNPGETTWFDVGDPLELPQQPPGTYTTQPFTTPDPYTPQTITYETPPLRRDIDNGAKYRVKVTSTALYSGIVNGLKQLTPYYSDEITLNVYRTVYIIDHPSDANVFANNDASFGVNAIASSGSDIFYKWQYTNSANGDTDWVDIPPGGSFIGQDTDLLIYDTVPRFPTYRYYRVVLSVPDQLASVTSFAGFLTIRRDRFNSISVINDAYIEEFDAFSFTVIAQSLSLRPPSYQWQKSTDYNTTTPTSATWSDLTGETSNIIQFDSAVPSDTGYYRLKLISAGEEVEYSNAAYLFVQGLNITVTRNIPTTLTFLEGLDDEYTFDVLGVSSIGTEVSYQWEIKRPGQSTFTDIGVGYDSSLSTDRLYTPRAFDRDENGSIIRCKMTAEGMPVIQYSNECTITVNRRFSYFADAAVKTLTSGSPLVLDLNPTWTGGNPTFQWQYSSDGGNSWQSLSGETSSFYSLNSVSSTVNGRQYRCLINLTNCSQHQYSRGGSDFIVTATSSTPTVSVTVVVTAARSIPVYYTKQTEKTGAAVGTVICVAKPPDYVNNPSATTDDVSQWQVANSGSITSSGDASSTISGTRPSWMDSSIDYRAPKWIRDRFPGYIEMRGQWLLKSDFRALYQVIGDAYGSTPGLNGKFRLPNLYGKKLMGTGNVNNNSGAVSVVPLYAQDTTSGGDKNVPGSMGGVYNYIKSRQLPPGSPGLSGEPDGVSTNTFALGSYNSTGFTDSTNQLTPSFQGSFNYRVGPMVGNFLPSVPTHAHSAVTVGWISAPTIVNNTCQGGSLCNPQFPGTEAAGGSIELGPAGIAEDQRGSAHTHGITINGSVGAGNGNDNHNQGKGSGGDNESDEELVSMQIDTGRPSAGMYMNQAEVGLTNQSRSLFNSGLNFYLRNNEQMPVHALYFRLKYLIKAY